CPIAYRIRHGVKDRELKEKGCKRKKIESKNNAPARLAIREVDLAPRFLQIDARAQGRVPAGIAAGATSPLGNPEMVLGDFVMSEPGVRHGEKRIHPYGPANAVPRHCLAQLVNRFDIPAGPIE